VHFLRGYGYWSIFSGVHPRIVTVWGDDVYTAPHLSRLRNWLSRRALAGADAITGDSKDILAHVEALGGEPAKLHLILWGVDFDRFHPVDGAGFRRRWSIPPQAPVVLSTRSFSRDYYNIDVIVNAIPRLRERYPNICVVFAAYDGEGGELRKRAAALGVDDAVRFVGRIDHAELPEAIGAADVFVTVPSLDATAVSLLEAMACGRAIVASDLPSNREWIVHGESGFIVPPRDVDALAARTLDLLGDEGLRLRFGARCMETARQRAGYIENMSRVESLYKELARTRRSGA
jgi:glycosyltransferase involved in cell wall biosynthesis